jgi:hypothetical protein
MFVFAPMLPVIVSLHQPLPTGVAVAETNVPPLDPKPPETTPVDKLKVAAQFSNGAVTEIKYKLIALYSAAFAYTDHVYVVDATVLIDCDMYFMSLAVPAIAFTPDTWPSGAVTFVAENV